MSSFAQETNCIALSVPVVSIDAVAQIDHVEPLKDVQAAIIPAATDAPVSFCHIDIYFPVDISHV